MAGNEEAATPAPGIGNTYRPTFAEFEEARAALAPAFAFGLQQAMASPARWAELSRAFLAMTAPGGGASAAGEPFLDAIFGASGLRTAVVRQASAMTGLAAPMLAEIMPKLAASGVEAMMRGAMGSLGKAGPNAMPGDDLGRVAAEMMRRGANAVEAMSRPSDAGRSAAAANPMSPTYFFDAFGDAMRTVWGSAGAAPPSITSAPAAPYLPFAAMFDAFAKGMGAAGAPGSAKPPAANAASPPGALPTLDAGLLDAFTQSGRRLQDGYVREMAALFAHFAAPGERKT